MDWSPARLRAFMTTRMRRAPNRIALSTAIRGTLATAIPLLVLPRLGMEADAGIVVIGALGAAMVDVGGLYFDRLLGMAVVTLAGPLLLLLGAVAEPWWVAAALAMFAVSMTGGLARAIGPLGVPLGLITVTAFLIGIEVGPTVSGHFAWRFALDYLAGGAWASLVTLATWHLRPYKRLELELAGAWEAVAGLVSAALIEAESESVVARRRQEQQLALRHAAATEAIERARATLGEIRNGTTSAGVVMAQLYVLLRAAARVAASALTLAETHADTDIAIARPKHRAATELEQACRAVARILADGRGEMDIVGFRAEIAALSAPPGANQGDNTSALAFIQALRHVDNAHEALALLFVQRHGLFELLRHAIANRPSFETFRAKVAAHLNFRSIIFRHGLRAATVSAAGTAVILILDLPHGIWLPMTAQAILQPEYGGTLTRAMQRTTGTLAGAVVAALLLVALRGTVLFEVAMVLMLFATLFLLRKNYGWAVTFLTPMVILLLKMSGPNPWADLGDRVLYTLAGAALAVIGGFHLWPEWERTRLPSRLARAVEADRKLVVAVIEGLGRTEPGDIPDLIPLRRDAEMAIANADAAFQNMLAEPTAYRARLSPSFQALVNIQRLFRHAIALTAHAGLVPAARPDLVALAEMLGQALEATGTAIQAGAQAPRRPDFDPMLARLAATIREQGGPGGTIALLLGRLVSDCSGLIGAANSR